MMKKSTFHSGLTQLIILILIASLMSYSIDPNSLTVIVVLIATSSVALFFKAWETKSGNKTLSSLSENKFVTPLMCLILVVALVFAIFRFQSSTNQCVNIINNLNIAPADVENHELLILVANFDIVDASPDINPQGNVLEIMYRLGQEINDKDIDLEVRVSHLDVMIKDSDSALLYAECLKSTILLWGRVRQADVRFSYVTLQHWDVPDDKSYLDEDVQIVVGNENALDSFISEGAGSDYVMNMMIAQLYYYSDEWQMALLYLDQALASQSSALISDRDLGLIYFRRGYTLSRLEMYDAAFESINQALELDPNNDKYINRRGLLYLDLGRLEEARADFNQVIAIDGRDAMYGYYNLARIYQEEGEYELALDNYSEAIGRGHTFSGTYARRANVYRSLGEYQNALIDINQAIEINPESAWAYYIQGYIYKDMGDMSMALSSFNQSQILDQSYSFAYYGSSDIYYTQGEYELALNEINHALELNSESSYIYNFRGIIQQKLGYHDLAIDDYTRAIELESDQPTYWRNRGNLYEQLDLFDLALADCSQALVLDPNYTDARNCRINVYWGLKDYRAAISDLEVIIENDPSAESYHRRANAYYNLGEYQVAVNDYTISIEIDPDDAETFRDRCDAYRNLGELDTALNDCNRAIELDPSFIGSYQSRAEVYTLLGMLDLAQSDRDYAQELELQTPE